MVTLTMREQCDRILASMIGQKHVELWWNSPNKAWQGKTPQEVFDGPDAVEVYNYLMDYAYGANYS